MTEDSLWMRCFWEVYEQSKKAGETEIKFPDVDDLVLKRSRMTIKDLVNYLGLTAAQLVNFVKE